MAPVAGPPRASTAPAIAGGDLVAAHTSSAVAARRRPRHRRVTTQGAIEQRGATEPAAGRVVWPRAAQAAARGRLDRHDDQRRGALRSALVRGSLLSPSAKQRMLAPTIVIHSPRQFPTLDDTIVHDHDSVGLAYGIGWGLLTTTPYGVGYFKEGHDDPRLPRLPLRRRHRAARTESSIEASASKRGEDL